MNAVNRGTALVTGATGFLAPYVAFALQQAGWTVRAGVRRPVSPSSHAQTVLVGDISGDTDWKPALAGVDAVVHVAARAHLPAAVQARERSLFLETNTAGTLALARAAAQAGVASFVFVSTIGVNGNATDGRAPFREDDPPSPQTVYAESKHLAEQGLADMDLGRSMAVTVIRPPLIYGRGPSGNFPLLARAVRSGLPLPFGSVSNRRAFVAAENVASFIAHRLDSAAPGLSTFLLADDEQVSTPEFMRRMGRACGRPVRLWPFPASLLRGALAAAGRAETAASLLGSLEIDPARTRATGWRPAVSLDEGLALALGEDASTGGSRAS